MNNIILIGFMGSGKTSVGYSVAETFGMRFADLDKEIEEVTGRSIPKIFTEEGEEGFRRRETEVFRAFSKKEGVVISTGGGIVEREENRSISHQLGHVIFLDASFEEISSRLQDDNSRPLWMKSVSERRKLFEQRLPVYKSWAEFHIDTDGKTVNEVVNEIGALINR